MSTQTEATEKKSINPIEIAGVIAVLIIVIMMIFMVTGNIKRPATVQSILLNDNGLQKLDSAYTEGGYPAVQSKIVQMYDYLTSSRNLVIKSNGNTVITFSDEGFSIDGTNNSCQALSDYIERNTFKNNVSLYADNNKVITPAECPSKADGYMLKISFSK